MTRNVKLSLALVAVFLVVIGVAALVAGGGDDEPAPAARTTSTAAAGEGAAAAAPAQRVVASDPRTLGREARGGPTFTEFLDFECEACGAAFPAIEELRRQYAGRVTFNVRYFPIDSHANARNAAHAAEAAAQQGKFEPMYEKLFETQRSWGEQQRSEAGRFRSYAKELGLDLKQYDADVASAKTKARVERDVQAGTALGVQSTPTFFLDEEMIQPQSLDELRSLLDQAVEGT